MSADFFCAPITMKLPERFEELSDRHQGLVVDGLYKEAMRHIHGDGVIIPEQGLEYDVKRVEDGQEGDVKLLRTIKTSNYGESAFVYLSHNEYLHDKENNVVYPIYWATGGRAEAVSFFSFSEAKERGAIALFDRGRKAMCARTGKEEFPWSIDVLIADPRARSLLT